jgi:acetate kinase
MGFSTLDGLVMGTRAGLMDSGVLLHLMRSEDMKLPELETLLYHESGLLGLSGRTADMKTLLESDDPASKLAVEIYCARITREIGSLAAALEGLDALVFTGGVGENAAPIRSRVAQAIQWLGDIDIRVIPTDEELTIARHTQRLLG